jgi:deoxyribodipyrimidine photo-lyase
VRTLVWFRGKDLRVADHTPLTDAAARGEVILLFVLDPYFFAPSRARELPHRMQFLLESVAELERRIAELGSRLVVVEGKSVDVVPRLAKEWRVERVAAYRWTEPFARERDRRVAAALDVPFELHEGETLVPPSFLSKADGTPYAVFTPFLRAFLEKADIAKPVPAPRTLTPLPRGVEATTAPIPSLEALGLVRNPRLVAGGETAAKERLRRFLAGPARRYHETRDRLDLDATSRLSQDLKFGTLSARTVWIECANALGRGPAWEKLRSELVWREFAYAQLFARPDLLVAPFRPEWEGFPWRDDERAWSAWTDGATGFPAVDAAARQLRAEGFVPNRARMLAASFLTKDLLMDFRRGEAHYMKWLTDGDWASNDLGWQWSAGCGCDAQPWFRVFNPMLQGEKFDPEGTWVKRFVPELADVPAKWIHRPWEAPPLVLAEAGVTLGETYPLPIVDHFAARDRFLAAARAHFGAAAPPARR